MLDGMGPDTQPEPEQTAAVLVALAVEHIAVVDVAGNMAAQSVREQAS